VPVVSLLVLALGVAMFLFVGRDFFPSSTLGRSSFMSAPAATRIEETERIFQLIEDRIRRIIPEKDRGHIVDNIGLPARVYNLAFTDGSTIGVNDGVILVSLKDGHVPTADYVRELRRILRRSFPKHLLLSGGGHGHPDPQFRPSRPNQRPYRRLWPGEEPADRAGNAAADRCHPGIADAHPPTGAVSPACTHRSIGRALPNSG